MTAVTNLMATQIQAIGALRHDWTRTEIQSLFDLPLADLMLKAQGALRAFHDPNHVQKSRLLNIKTGGCAENCGYCSQSAHVATGLKASRLMAPAEVAEAAARAKADGAERFCMGAAWRELKDRDLPAIVAMIGAVRANGLETCMTLGMLTDRQAEVLAQAGLDYYNHNLDTGRAYYPSVVSTRSFDDRLDTLARVRRAGMKVCCGGILGMGERAQDRADLLAELARLDPHPESVPINRLVPIEGTPLANADPIDGIDFARWIAVARIVFPASIIRLAAGREQMSDELQALCLLAGANSIFVGDRLLTTPLPGAARDAALFGKVEGVDASPSAY